MGRVKRLDHVPAQGYPLFAVHATQTLSLNGLHYHVQGVNGYSTACADPAEASAQSRSTHATTTRHAAADTGNKPTRPPYTDVVAINATGVEVHCLRSTLQQVWLLCPSTANACYLDLLLAA